MDGYPKGDPIFSSNSIDSMVEVLTTNLYSKLDCNAPELTNIISDKKENLGLSGSMISR